MFDHMHPLSPVHFSSFHSLLVFLFVLVFLYYGASHTTCFCRATERLLSLFPACPSTPCCFFDLIASHHTWWWWWYYPTPSEGWRRGGTSRKPNSRTTPQGLDHRSRIEREQPKIDLRRDSEAGQSRRR